MSDAPTTDKPDLKPEWIILLLVSVGVAAVLGRPIGIVFAFLGSDIHDGSVSEWEKALIIWLQWTSWAVPLAIGVVTLAVGIPFIGWNAPARTKGKVLATGAIWLGYVVLVLAGNTLFRLGYKVGGPVAFGALAIIPSVITLLIWGARKRGTQPPQ
jgi:hypothetical protein